MSLKREIEVRRAEATLTHARAVLTVDEGTDWSTHTQQAIVEATEKTLEDLRRARRLLLTAIADIDAQNS